MTEAKWLLCEDPRAMLGFLRDKATDRKLRLFACACCRHIPHLIADESARQTIEVIERYADGVATEAERAFAHRKGEGAVRWRAVKRAAVASAKTGARMVLDEACLTAAFSPGLDYDPLLGLDPLQWQIESRAQAHMLRDIFVNPFRPVPLNPAWLAWNDGTIRKMAQIIYDERRFNDLPSLGDALEDAGCTNADILAHCRQPGEHARGCWVVDCLLDKS